MKIIKNVMKLVEQNDLKYQYSYRLVQNIFENDKIYGIEVERFDFSNESLINIERDFIKYISRNEAKAIELLNLLADNIVSPIHLVDVLGEYVDKYIENLNEETVLVYS